MKHTVRRMHAKVRTKKRPGEMYFPRLVNIYRPPLLEAKETPGPIDGSAWAMRPAVIVGARCSFGAWPMAQE